MKLQALLQQLYHEPALITPEAHDSIRRLLEWRLGLAAADDASAFAARDPAAGICGQKVEVEQAEIIDGIMHIPINGVIGQKLDPFSRGEGAVDTLDIANEIDEAEADDEVRAVLFEFDSPGGMIAGTPELAEQIARMTKPNVAFTNGLMCSASYWVGSGCQKLYATSSATIGSIGVILPYTDASRRMENAGIKTDLIKAGKFKGAGWPGVPMNADQREQLQARVDQMHTMMKDHIRDMRLLNAGNLIDDDSMEGQSFLAREAQSRGLIDGIVRNKAAVIRMLN